MLRTTQNVVELRHWAESRGALPCREEGTGRLGLAFPGVPCAAREVGWDEFEPTFVTTRCVFVYDDAPGACRCFIGASEDAHAFVAQGCAGGAGASP
jgi:hypothetical protein